jgi:hypothetical protein
MAFQQVIAELRARYPRAVLGPTAMRGECFARAGGIEFKQSKGGMYKGRADDGHEVVVYYNDTEHIICCTEGVAGSDE